MKRLGIITAATMVALAACADPAGVSNSELALAQESQLLVEAEISRTHDHYLGWLGRILAELRNTDDPEARAFLEQARALHEQAAAARAAGNFEEARRLHEQAFRAVLSAVIELHPDAPARTGTLVDNVVARIEDRLGDREAPRIRRILAHVEELRTDAKASDSPVTALALNLRAIQILHRLVHHVRSVSDRERDRVADDEMQQEPVRRD
jgi:hypothetical protein